MSRATRHVPRVGPVRLLAAALGVTTLAACSSVPPPSPSVSSAPSSSPAATFGVATLPDACPVTVAQSGATPPPLVVPNPQVGPLSEGWYGNAAVWIELPKRGILPATPDPGQTTISIKFPWFPAQPGQLTVSGEALHGGGRFSGDVAEPAESGGARFVPSTLTFEHPGCWRITGALQGQELSFVTYVRRASPLLLQPTSGPAGAEVTGTGGFTAPVEPIRAFLVAQAAADAVTSPEDSRLVAVDKLVVDTDAYGYGRITFHVPHVEQGAFSAMIYCPACAATMAGQTILWVADFEVTSASPSTDT